MKFRVSFPEYVEEKGAVSSRFVHKKQCFSVVTCAVSIDDRIDEVGSAGDEIVSGFF